MKRRTIFMTVIAILIILTASIMIAVIDNVSSEVDVEKPSPATNGAYFVYSYTSELRCKSFPSNSIYKNETLKHGDLYINGRVYINITGSSAVFHSYLCNSTGTIIANRTFSEPLNGTIFTAMFPEENHINTGNIVIFGNNVIAIKGMYTTCPSSHYVVNYGKKQVQYIPYIGKIESLTDVIQDYNYSLFNYANFIQSRGYSILSSISIPGNSSIAAMIQDNIGIKTSWFTMKLDRTNVGITAINYISYIEKYTIVYAVIWIIGIGYLISIKVKKKR
ncbi:hypothetical protein ACLIKE_09860 [Ferroplasma acidiphilum]|uniref:Uncharacterized protein n=1 Tax=Ferroplasma acidiphilum TaxID=74969 RepID=A0A1V0N5T4_9ARCH|nr:hypothetical protein [Ferroplasma acidiphilum]ARD85510.1 hypothetical protein FAD_1666 [Ferroplasma acidiphilum]NOL59309.1 hypothetical protein [Ferroplasma acidiphilum]